MPALLSTLIGRRTSKFVVWLPRATQEEMTAQVAEAEPDETGGILLGYTSPRGHQVVITHLVGPGPKSQGTRAHFEPDGAWQEKEVARLYKESGRHATYLGDWHSHPDGFARPSRKDRRTAKKIAGHVEARMRNPLMLIVATTDSGFRFACFRYSRRKLRHVTLRLY